MATQPPGPRWRSKLHEVIFEADTPAGKAFDIALLVAILASVLVVVLESVPSVRADHGRTIWVAEWGFTILFTVEYLLRLIAVRQPARYARSFFGIVDLLAVLPTYLSMLLPGAQAFLVVRALRLLRVFRILKLGEFIGEARMLMLALKASVRKILVFLAVVLVLVLIIGSVMYLVETPESGFTSIPQSIYWAIVTLTTVGYGDIAPQTVLGRILASLVMILGYGLIAVPTGIVTVELSQTGRTREVSTQACPNCGLQGHDPDARHCKHCGASLGTGPL
ncbi:MAG TPA: ion transporter [Thermoanaerobaculia bacterium]|nr:ion transporter [Thermoanaerobaculia bacterium]